MNSIEYTANGFLEELSFADGTITNPDNRYRVGRITTTLGAETLFDEQYSYDYSNNITMINNRAQHYDELNRLRIANIPNPDGEQYEYGYDAAGNRTFEIHAGVLSSYKTDANGNKMIGVHDPNNENNNRLAPEHNINASKTIMSRTSHTVCLKGLNEMKTGMRITSVIIIILTLSGCAAIGSNSEQKGSAAIESNSEQNQIINMMYEADALKWEIYKGLDWSMIDVYNEIARSIVPVEGKYTDMQAIMSVMGKYFSIHAAECELRKVGIYIIDSVVGVILANGDIIPYIDDKTTYRFIIDEKDIKLIEVRYEDEEEGWWGSDFYKLKKIDGQWKITDVGDAYEEENNWVMIRSSTEMCSIEDCCLANRAYDKDITTAWAEDREGDGIGEWIEISLAKSITIDTITLINGYAKDILTYQQNNRVKRIKVLLDDNEICEAELMDNELGYQNIKLPNVMNAERIRLIILEVYPGSQYQNTYISEIGFIK